jgi:hypothetical protein
MSPDEREQGNMSHESEIDDGVIHEWLDGQLNDADGARLEALVATSPAFAARVAEARGFIAASSRILSALDDVPGGVLPGAQAPREPEMPNDGSVRSMQAARDARSRAANPRTSRFTWQRLTGVAALLAVAVTGTLVIQRTPMDDAPVVGSTEIDSVPAPHAAMAPAVVDAPAEQRAANLKASTQVVASADAPVPSVSAASQAAPAAPPSPARADVAPQKVARSEVARSEVARSEVARSAAPRDAAGRSAAAFEMAAAPRRLAAEADEPSLQGSIPSAELAYSVQRVECAPACRQLRIDLARDGRAHRSAQQFGGASTTETGRVDTPSLTRLAQLADSLDLASLPPMLRLEGSRCRTVGSLRESLRVEFRRGDTLRNVMGLPWCTDGTHPLDIMARAIEQAAAAGIDAARP